jgi:hypothetical protein
MWNGAVCYGRHPALDVQAIGPSHAHVGPMCAHAYVCCLAAAVAGIILWA